MHHYLKFFVVVLISLVLTACAQPPGNSPQDKRAEIDNMKNQTLAILYKRKPELQAEIENAPGYAVFSDVGMHFVFLGNAHGYGEVVDNTTGKVTYMKVLQVNAGLGLQVKQFRNVFVFKTPQALNKFISKGWEFGGSADATAESGGKGASGGGEAYANDDLKIYQLNKSGLSLQATLGGTKYWRYKELNQPDQSVPQG